MKNFSSSFILIAVALLLGAYVFFFERGPVKKEEKKDKVFTRFVADDVKEIKLHHPAAAQDQLIDIQKDNADHWQITAPRKLKADEAVMRGVLMNVGDMSPEDTLDHPNQLADYGLNTQAAQADFIFKDGTQQTLVIGDKDISGSSAYVKPANQPKVYLVPSYVTDNFAKSVDDFRDHSVIATDLVQADELRITRGAKTLELKKDKDNNWNLARPVAGKADPMKVRDVLTAANDLKIEKFETDHPANLKIYGLASPSVILEIGSSQAGSKDQVLYLGRDKLKTTDVFAQLKGQDAVFLVPQSFEKSLDLKPDNFKDKTLLQFDASRASRLTVSHDGKSIVYVKDAQGRWQSLGRDKANDEGSGVLSQLALLTIADFSAEHSKSGLRHPAYSVEVTFDDQTAHHYQFGNREQDKIYVTANFGSKGKSPEVYLVSGSVVAPLEGIFSAPVPAKPSPVSAGPSPTVGR
jgi:hypothetical protein